MDQPTRSDPAPLPLVFSDLDGTLLDHDDYSFSAAQGALRELQARGIALILASSKTRAEMQPIARQLGAAGLIFENGGGVDWPDGLQPPADGAGEGISYVGIRRFIAALPEDLRRRLTGFGDMDEADVAALTGLAPDAARLARQREFSEPFAWTGTPAQLDDVRRRAGNAGLRLVRGGRFNTLCGREDKASRLRQVCDAYARQAGDGCRPWSIALGDAPNDAAMLDAADRGFIIANPHGASMPRLAAEAAGRVTRSRACGPAGWNESILTALEELDTMFPERQRSANG